MTNDTTLFNTDDDFFLEDDDLENPDQLAEQLIGEGKKYKNTGEIAKKVIHADRHIARLERENSELRGKVTNEKTIEALLERISSSRNTDPSNANTNGDEQAEKQPVLRPEEIAEKVLQEIERKQTLKQQEQNLNKVKDSLVNLYGRSYPEKLSSLAEEAGLTAEDLDTLAKKSPTAFFKVLGVDPTAKRKNEVSLFSVPNSSVDTSKMKKTFDGTVRNNAFYENLRKTDPKKFNSAEVQVARMRDAEKLGQDFFS